MNYTTTASKTCNLVTEKEPGREGGMRSSFLATGEKRIVQQGKKLRTTPQACFIMNPFNFSQETKKEKN